MLGGFMLAKESFGAKLKNGKGSNDSTWRSKLRDELNRLLKLRPIISAAIGETRELGDLKENAEYHAQLVKSRGIY